MRTRDQPVLAALGLRASAEAEPRSVLDVYLPDQTQDGDTVLDHSVWVRLVADAAVALAGGCTVLPAARGYWRNSATGQLIQENTTVVRTYATRTQLLEGGAAFRSVLNQYRREADQASVAVTLDGEWLELTP